MDSEAFPEFTRQFVKRTEQINEVKIEKKGERITRERDESARPGDQPTTSSMSDGTEPSHKKPRTALNNLVSRFLMKLHWIHSSLDAFQNNKSSEERLLPLEAFIIKKPVFPNFKNPIPPDHDYIYPARRSGMAKASKVKAEKLDEAGDNKRIKRCKLNKM